MDIQRKPDWLKIKMTHSENFAMVKKIVKENQLHTICSSGRCPNQSECWSRGTATFMIMGNICTRACKFCATKTGCPFPLDSKEPEKVAESVKLMKLKHCIITSVDRDDLDDKGAAHWAATVKQIREQNPQIIIELLIPDYEKQLLDVVFAEKPDIVAHNLETVKRLTATIRSKASYMKSLQVLKDIAQAGFICKTGIMVGLGETEQEVLELFQEVKDTGCRIITIGQYLQPTKENISVVEYITPAQFVKYREVALMVGFESVESAPLVRSSYVKSQKN